MLNLDSNFRIYFHVFAIVYVFGNTGLRFTLLRGE